MTAWAARGVGVFAIAASMSCGPSTQPTDSSLPLDVATDGARLDAPISSDGGDSYFDAEIDASGADQVASDVAPDEPDAGADVFDDGAFSIDADVTDDGSIASDADDTIDTDAGGPSDADDVSSDGSAGIVVRIVAGNLTSGSGQSYTPGEGIRIFRGLRPDVALIQEFNYGANSMAEIRAFVDAAFGTTYQFVRGTGTLPNGVASRYPIIASGDWTDPFVTNRTFVWARIDVPGPHDLWAVSLHLLTSGATTRNSEAATLVSEVESNVPVDDLLVVGGDLNTDTRTEPCIASLEFAVSTASPYPTDQFGNSNTNAPRTRPYDWLLADPDLRMLEIPVAIGANVFPSGLLFDTRVYTPLGDVAPALAGDSAAAGMQHMAVVRDFRLP